MDDEEPILAADEVEDGAYDHVDSEMESYLFQDISDSSSSVMSHNPLHDEQSAAELGRGDEPTETISMIEPNHYLPNDESSIRERANQSFFNSKPITKVRSRWKSFKRYWSIEGWKTVLIALWVLANIGLFMMEYYFFVWGSRKRFFEIYGYGVAISRGAAEAIKLNCALMLLFVLRNTISWLRGTWLNNYIPFDKNIVFHRYVGYTILFWAVIHIFSHMFNWLSEYHADVDTLNAILKTHFKTSPTPLETAFTTLPGITGHIIVLCMFLIYTSAKSQIRRPNFEAFWYTHHLFVIMYGLLLFHGATQILEPATFYRWVAIPILLYFIERMIRIKRGSRGAILCRAIQHPSRVTELQFISSHKFNYKPGQYLFLNCPFLSKQEWHPFTISSSPQDAYFSVHIRVAGDWTGALQKAMNPNGIKQGVVQKDLHVGPDGGPMFRVDGPFGAASEEIFQYSTAILIGCGIGVTPFASILKFIQFQVNRSIEQNIPIPYDKIYFFWIARDKSNFEWFADLLAEMEETNPNKFLEIRAYFTGKVDTVQDIRKLIDQRDADLDVITGLSSRTYFGRPNWPVLFSTIEKKHRGSKIGVFYCGPSVLSKSLRVHCRRSSTSQTKFVFKKENF